MDKIDTSIFTNYRNPYPIDVQERALKQQTLNSLVAQNQRADQQFQQEQQLRQYEIDQKQLFADKQRKISDLYKLNASQNNGKLNYDTLLPKLYQIDPEAGQKAETNYNDILDKKQQYAEHIATAQKANEDLNKMKLDARMKEYGLAYNVLSSVKQFDNDGWQNAKQMLLHSGLQLQMPDDTPINIPDKYDANFVQALNGMSTTIGDAFTRQQDIDKAKLEREKFEETKRSNLESEKTEWYKATHPASTIGAYGSPDGGGSGGLLNSEDEKIATNLAFAKIDPQSFNKMYSKFKGNDERMRQVYLRAQEINPDFDFAKYTADFQSYKNNAQRTQFANLDRADRLLNRYQELSDAVKRGDIKAVNKVANVFKLNFSNINATNLKTLQTVMTEDLSRALTQSGATSDKKMEMAGDISDIMDVSNKAASEKIKIIREVIGSNKAAIKGNWGAFGDKNANKDISNLSDIDAINQLFPASK